LFCPRCDDTEPDGSLYYDEDVANQTLENDPAAEKLRKQKIEEAEKRKWVALEASQILAFEGDEASIPREWLLSRLNELMSSCDVCVRVFHKSKAEWKNRLFE
jgi:senataxin